MFDCPYIINRNFTVSEEICNLAIEDVLGRFNRGDWCKANEYQHGLTTNPNLFESNEEYWQAIKKSFLDAISDSFSIASNSDSKVKSWCYLSIPKTPSVLNWHSHYNKNLKKYISSIMYLNLPKGIDGFFASTTEFLLNDGSTLSPPPLIGHWIFFENNQLHRPGHWAFNRMNDIRLTLAVDFLFELS